MLVRVKLLQSTIYEVDLDRLLQSIHVYLQELGMEEIRRRYISLNALMNFANIILFIMWRFFVLAITNSLSFVLGWYFFQ